MARSNNILVVPHDNTARWGGEEGTKVWLTKPDGKKHYLSVNAVTLDEGQPNLDLREWHEKGWVFYVDCLERKGKPTFDGPYVGGMY